MPNNTSSKAIAKKRKQSKRQQAWLQLFTLVYPDHIAVWETFYQCSYDVAQTKIQARFERFQIEPDISFGLAHRVHHLNEWIILCDYLRKVERFVPTANEEAKVIAFALLPQECSLSQKEIGYLHLFLSEYPKELPLWEAAYGKTPRQFAALFAVECCKRELLPEREIDEIKIKLSIGLTWSLLLRRLSAGVIHQASDNYALTQFIDLIRLLIECLPQRHDQYGDALPEVDWSPLPIMPFHNSPYRQEALKHSQNASIYFPPNDYVRCRLCWRYVPVHPKKAQQQAPLCHVHEMGANDALYRARFRKKVEMEKKLNKLKREYRRDYMATKNTEEAWEYIKKLLLSDSSPLPLLAAHMQQHCLKEPNAETLLWAYLAPECGEMQKADKKSLEPFVRFALSTPLPITFEDCLVAEAWLKTMQDKRRKDTL